VKRKELFARWVTSAEVGHRTHSRALQLLDTIVRPARQVQRGLRVLLAQNAKEALPAFSLAMPSPGPTAPKVPRRQLRVQRARHVPGVHPSRRIVVRTLADIVLKALLRPLVHHAL